MRNTVSNNARKSVFFCKKNKNYLKNIFVLHISSSYAKILGDTNFHTREIPRSGSKAKDGERLNDGDNNGQATHGARMAHAWRMHGPRMAHAWRTHGACKLPGEKKERLNDGSWPSYAWRTQARMAHASRLGQYFM